MRILHLVSCRGWSSDAYWAARIARELGRRGHEVTLGCRRGADTRVIDGARAEGVGAIVTYEFAPGVKPLADTRDLARLVRDVRAADVVHVHRGKEHWLAAAAARAGGARTPIVRTRHIAQAVRPHAGNRWLYRRATALVVCVTDAIRCQYVAAGLVPAARAVTIAGGADADAYRPRCADATVRRALGGVDGEPLAGMVGGLRVMKGHAVALAALAQLAERKGAPRLAIVGRGAMEPRLREEIARRGVAGRVTMQGWSNDLPIVMASLDIGLYVPLESDGMSRIVFEYLAAGRPLIASRVGVVPEVLVDGDHALLVPAGDAVALAAALDRLAGDPTLRARLGERGRRLVEERYSGACVATALEAHYARLLGS